MKKRLFCFVTAIITFFGVANAQKTVTIGTGTDSSVTCPVNTVYGYSFVEELYLDSELNMPVGSIITSLSFYYVHKSGDTIGLDRKVTVYLQNTKKSFFDEKDYLTVNRRDMVYGGRLSANASGWVTLQLDMPFVYTGGNLLLAINDSTGTRPGHMFLSHTAAEKRRYVFCWNVRPFNVDSLDKYNSSKTSANDRANIRIGYMDTVFRSLSIGNDSEAIAVAPVNTIYKYSIVETIYLGSELNLPAGSSINSLSYFHVRQSSADSTILNRDVVVYMTNTEKSCFSSTSEYITPTVSDQVYSGKLTADKSGWITLQLDSIFIYSGGNIMIAFDDNTGASGGQHLCFLGHTTDTTLRLAFCNNSENPDIDTPDVYYGKKVIGKERPNIRIGFSPAATVATLPYSSDFTDTADNDNWIIKNMKDAGLSAWRFFGGKLFTNGHNPDYNSVTVLAERLFDPGYSDSIAVSFDCYVNTEDFDSVSVNDYFAAYLVPSDSNWQPNEGMADSAVSYIGGAGVYDVPYILHFGMPASLDNTKIAFANGKLSATVANPTPGKNLRLVFVWRNNGQDGTGEGVIIRNLSVTGIKLPIEYVPNSTAQWYGYATGDVPENFKGRFVSFSMRDLKKVTVATDNVVEDNIAATFADDKVWYFTNTSPIKVGNAYVDKKIRLIYGFRTTEMTSGPTGVIMAVAYNTVDGKLYSIDENSKLYRMDLNNMDSVMEIGTLDSTLLTFAIDAKGEAYGITAGVGNLLKVNLTDATTTLVGNTGVTDVTKAQSMAFDNQTGELFWASCRENIPYYMYYVDVTTGKAKRIGTLFNEAGMEITGMFATDNPDVIRNATAQTLMVYPNPATNMLNIWNADNGMVRVYDVTGREVIRKDVTAGKEMIQLDITNLNSGIYFLKVGNHTAKFVKE